MLLQIDTRSRGQLLENSTLQTARSDRLSNSRGSRANKIPVGLIIRSEKTGMALVTPFGTFTHFIVGDSSWKLVRSYVVVDSNGLSIKTIS
jgi:hypothetical protein